jgi:hypothetical protein
MSGLKRTTKEKPRAEEFEFEPDIRAPLRREWQVDGYGGFLRISL